MAKKKDENLEKHLETHNVEVPLPKTSFRDERMNSINCPLCKNELKLLKLEEHSFGEFGFYQCETCGSILDICNMVNKPAEFSIVSKLVHGQYFQSIKTILREHSKFSLMPATLDINYIEKEKEKKSVEKKSREEYCISCGEKFLPQKSCEAVRSYCLKCRKDIPKDDKRWKKTKKDE